MLIRTVGCEYFLLELIETYRPIIGSELAGRIGERTLQSLFVGSRGGNPLRIAFSSTALGFFYGRFLMGVGRQASPRDIATL
jgi:hypothetical protein